MHRQVSESPCVETMGKECSRTLLKAFVEVACHEHCGTQEVLHEHQVMPWPTVTTLSHPTPSLPPLSANDLPRQDEAEKTNVSGYPS